MQDLKRTTTRMKKELWAAGCEISHGNVYELVAAYHGYNSYAAMRAGAPGQMTVTRRIEQLGLQENWDLIETAVFRHMENESEQTAD